jgi:hypothetical protein
MARCPGRSLGIPSGCHDTVSGLESKQLREWFVHLVPDDSVVVDVQPLEDRLIQQSSCVLPRVAIQLGRLLHQCQATLDVDCSLDEARVDLLFLLLQASPLLLDRAQPRPDLR